LRKRQEQRVAVKITHGEAAASDLEVRLYQQQQCQGAFEHRALAKDGTATFSRIVEIGGLGVITDELSVCVESKGNWQPLFLSFHAPAPALIEIACDLDSRERRCATKFDGRPLDEFIDDEDDA
jgi:hypothetical protein